MAFKLDATQHDAFQAALDVDDADQLLTVIEAAIQKNSWPPNSWWDVRIGNIHYLRAVAGAGQPNCFLRLVDFVFSHSDWSALSPSERDGLVARFPADAQEYIARRMGKLGPISQSAMAVEAEMVSAFQFFLRRQIEIQRPKPSSLEEIARFLEECAAELGRQIQSNFSKAISASKSSVSGEHRAQVELLEIGNFITKATSEAATRLRM